MSKGSANRIDRFLENSSFIRHYLWKYRKWVCIGLGALILVDILDILPPIFLKQVVDIVVDRGPTTHLAWMAAAYVGTALIQGVCRYGWRMFLIRSSIFAGRDLRSKYAKHLFGLSMSFFDQNRMGDLMSLATNDVEAVRIAIGTGLLVLADALIFVLTVPVAMMILSPRLTFLACLPLPLIPLFVLKNEREIHLRFEKVQACFGRISAMTQESLNGIRLTKAFAREDTQIQRMRAIGEEYSKLNLALAQIQCSMGPTMDFLMSLGLVILLFVGGGEIVAGRESAITLGTFVAFQRFIQKMVWPMSALGMAINYYQRSVSSSDRLKGILSIQTDVPEIEKPKSPVSQGKVEFRNLTFTFPGCQQPVLKNINLVIEPGERVAFVGAIGAGKSALLSLLPRLYPIARDMLFIDGVDINDWSILDLRRQVGYVSQEVFLFSETVMENVGFGLQEWFENPHAVDAIEDAARVASVHDEITRFSASYRTRLGERGVNLSGGQKQRLTIARALAKEPTILVLDDALSSVDVQTEERVLHSLRTRRGRNTELIAAHRISTIKDADRIVVLQSGEILQQGNHQELIQNPAGGYWKFYQQQEIKEDLDHYDEKSFN